MKFLYRGIVCNWVNKIPLQFSYNNLLFVEKKETHTFKRFSYIPENGCRLYRNFFPLTLNFFGTGGSDDRLVVGSLVSVKVK